MKKRLICAMTLTAFILGGISGCSGNKSAQRENVEGLKKLGAVHAVAREDGSGTRNSFAQLLGFDTAMGEQSDSTREDAVIAESTEAVVETVSKDKSAIGYVSWGAIENTDKIKILDVDNSYVGDKNYSLTRSFYLVYSGKTSEVEQEFFEYVGGAGQDTVSKSFLPVAKSSSFLSTKPKGSIKIGGSSSMAPLIKELAQEYMQYNPNAQLTVEQTDSTDGINGAMSGKYDLGMSSRDLKDYESELLDYKTVAQDKIAVIVQADNPLLSVSKDELQAIYSGKINKWDELNG